jgi:hypothetical protein
MDANEPPIGDGSAAPYVALIQQAGIIDQEAVRSPFELGQPIHLETSGGSIMSSLGTFVHSWMSAAPADLLPLYSAGYSPLLQQGTLFRRSVFERLNGFDESYRFVGDADFWWRALEAGHVFRRDAHPPVAAFRLHSGQLTQRFNTPMQAEHERMVSAHGGRRRSLRSWSALCRFRGGNMPSYIVRFLRRRDLEGRIRLARSYDFSREAQ